MKNFCFLIFALLSISLHAQSRDPWVVYRTPSASHEFFAKYAGSFSMEITLYNGDSNPVVNVVDSQHEMILGGRFLEMTQTGTIVFMDYASRITLGINNATQQITSTTLTNFGTGTLTLVGSWLEDNKKAVLYGTLANPVTKNFIKIRQEITFVDENTIIIENFDQEGDGLEIKTVHYKLTRN